MRPEKEEAEARKCEAVTKKFSVRPRPKHVAEATVYNESCNI